MESSLSLLVYWSYTIDSEFLLSPLGKIQYLLKKKWAECYLSFLNGQSKRNINEFHIP